MSAPFCCQRCGRAVEMDFPAGEPAVTLTVLRFFHVRDNRGQATSQPAGALTQTMCLRCDTTLWPTMRTVLPPATKGAGR